MARNEFEFWGYDREQHEEFPFTYEGKKYPPKIVTMELHRRGIGHAMSFFSGGSKGTYFFGRPYRRTLDGVSPDLVLHKDGNGEYALVPTADWAKREVQDGLVEAVVSALNEP
tara:strand:- start:1105 stop:1443 length:339 start_codon:yes stop_codon:yes gene_type:complete